MKHEKKSPGELRGQTRASGFTGTNVNFSIAGSAISVQILACYCLGGAS
jgi:hypothetical protein